MLTTGTSCEKQLLRRSPGKDQQVKNQEKPGEAKKEPRKDKLLLCRNCGNIVTKAAYRIDKNGKHQHTFTNPGGYLFCIGCFSKAPGSINHGEPTDEFSWFSGFCWRYTLCMKCFNHLGWHFQDLNEGFYGLILERLVETGLS